MPIIGLTDKKETNTIPVMGTLWKGTPKINGQMGSDLEGFIRVNVPDMNARRIAEIIDGEVRGKGDDMYAIASSLVVYAAFPDIEKTFDPLMRAYNASSPLVVCDRQTIKAESASVTTKDGVFNSLQSCSKTCPIADEPIGASCPNGCKPQGDLHLYLQSFLRNGFDRPFRFRLKDYSSIMGVLSDLAQIQSTYTSIKSSPVPFPMGMIPLVLSRNLVNIKRPVLKNGKRTGKKANDTAHPVKISVHPDYMRVYAAFMEENAMKSLQSGSRKALQSSEFVDIEVFIDPDEEEEALSLLGVDNEDIPKLTESSSSPDIATSQKKQGDIEKLLEYFYNQMSGCDTHKKMLEAIASVAESITQRQWIPEEQTEIDDLLKTTKQMIEAEMTREEIMNTLFTAIEERKELVSA